MIVSHKITGDWRTVVDDTPADPDPYPDEVIPTGHVRFVPVTAQPVWAGGTAYTIGPVTALIADGQLRDLQGRDGVWLATHIGDQQLEWEATITLHHPYGTNSYTTHLRVDGDLHMTGDDL